VLATIAIMIIAGILGSYCRQIFENQEGGNHSVPNIRFAGILNVVVPGIVASFVVPLFLSIGRSEVFSNAVNGKQYADNIFILFGFCLLAAVSARSFVNALARQALQRAETAEQRAEAAGQKAEAAGQKAEAAGQKAEAAGQKAEEATELVSEETKSSTDRPRAYTSFEGTDQEKSVMKSLTDGEWVRRSLTGIAKDAKLDKGEVRAALASLVERGLVVEAPSTRTGALLYQAQLESQSGTRTKSNSEAQGGTPAGGSR
jgi:hypothetical protein